MSDDTAPPVEPATAPKPSRPTGALAVMYPRDTAMLEEMLKPLEPMPHDSIPRYSERSQFLAMIGHYCAALHPESKPEFTAFLSPTTPRLVTVVLWSTPPVVIMETPFTVSEDAPPAPTEQRPPILGPDGRPLA